MAEPKTTMNDGDVNAFIDSVQDEQKRKDCYTVMEIMKRLTGASPKMWGGSIVGFGTYHYTYASGKTGDWPVTGFSPRKQNLTLYIMNGFTKHEDVLKDLGKFKTGKSCLYVKKLADVDQDSLEVLIQRGIDAIKEMYPTEFN